MSDRDRKILMVLAPLLVLVGYWFLVLSPKREEAAKAGDELAAQEDRRDAAKAVADQAAAAKSNFASDYVELVRLGKAIPSSVDMPSLIVQLDRASRGTGIRFVRIATGEREGSPAPTTAPPPKAPGEGDGSQPAAAGGAPAQSGSGQATEAAGNATNAGNDRSAAAEQSGVNPGDTQTSTQAKEGGVPVGGGEAGSAAGGASGTGAPGLETVPLELEFRGDFFRLANFFHSLKRFVYVANEKIRVRGRLLTVDSLTFTSDPELFPKLKAEINATVYLTPKAEGATAGATPEGPAPAAAAGGSQAPPTAPAPTATSTPSP